MWLVCILLRFGSVEIARAFQVGCGRVWNSFVECQILGRGGEEAELGHRVHIRIRLR